MESKSHEAFFYASFIVRLLLLFQLFVFFIEGCAHFFLIPFIKQHMIQYYNHQDDTHVTAERINGIYQNFEVCHAQEESDNCQNHSIGTAVV